ncbi:hypothetical protein L208DRAFT_156446 [Tricholoma matsutake]|nr:hypothetical protein L208DRAFT_156446 [Tricholoma matsutake 945]
MPLDSHSYLLSQGWTGKGTGLRHGAIARPLAIPQKKTLAGLGKDRDEAFPFWDHLFSAAAKSIQLKVISDDDDDERDSATVDTLKRTATGILSNRRPVTGTPANTSGTNTPDTSDQAPRSTLLSIAKREAAKHGLYARFFRGPVLGPESYDQNDTDLSNTGETLDVGAQAGVDVGSADWKSAKKRTSGEDNHDEKRRRKKQKRESREKRKEEQKATKESARKGTEKAQEDQEVQEKKQRKREAKDGKDLSRKEMRKREKKMKVPMSLELDEEGERSPEISQDRPRKKKRRTKSEDEDKRKRKRKDTTT